MKRVRRTRSDLANDMYPVTSTPDQPRLLTVTPARSSSGFFARSARQACFTTPVLLLRRDSRTREHCWCRAMVTGPKMRRWHAWTKPSTRVGSSCGSCSRYWTRERFVVASLRPCYTHPGVGSTQRKLLSIMTLRPVFHPAPLAMLFVRCSCRWTTPMSKEPPSVSRTTLPRTTSDLPWCSAPRNERPMLWGVDRHVRHWNPLAPRLVFRAADGNFRRPLANTSTHTCTFTNDERGLGAICKKAMCAAAGCYAGY